MNEKTVYSKADKFISTYFVFPKKTPVLSLTEWGNLEVGNRYSEEVQNQGIPNMGKWNKQQDKLRQTYPSSHFPDGLEVYVCVLTLNLGFDFLCVFSYYTESTKHKRCSFFI